MNPQRSHQAMVAGLLESLSRWILTEKAVICSPPTVFLCVTVANRFQEKG